MATVAKLKNAPKKLNGAAPTAAKAKPVAAKAKPAAKEAAKPAKPKVIINVGDDVIFKGYHDGVAIEDGGEARSLFQPGQRLRIVEKTKNADGIVLLYSAIDVGDVEDFESGKDVDGEQLIMREFKKAKPMKQPKLSKFDAEAAAFRPVGEVAKILKKVDGAPALLDRAKHVLNDVRHSEFLLGGLLAKLLYSQGDDNYKALGDAYAGDNGWDKFCDEHFGFQGRKGRALVAIYMAYSRIPNFDHRKLDEIGWSKAEMLAAHVTADNVDDLLETASEQSVSTLRDTIKTRFVGESTDGRRNREKITLVTFGPYRLAEDMADTVSKVLSAAEKELGIADANMLFHTIVTNWAMENLNSAAAKKAAARGAKLAQKQAEKQAESVTA